MIAFNRPTATLVYLAAVLLLGGASAAGQTGNLLLQLGGAGLIGWTLWSADRNQAIPTGLRRFALALAVLALVQFLPLPPALWTQLPGREAVSAGFAMLEVPLPWLTLSLAPWQSLASLTWWLPALALFMAMRAEGAPQLRQIAVAVTSVAALSVAVGAMQLVAGSGYFYAITNFGTGPGFFANTNHQGTFLLCALALWAAFMADERVSARRRAALSWTGGNQAVYAAIGLLLIAGVLVSNSLACLALLVPVLVASAGILRPGFKLPVWLTILAIVLTVGGLIAFLLYGPVANDLTAKGAVTGISRREFLLTGSRIAADFAPFGSGLGTFQDLYKWYEDPTVVGTIFVNHAHDDLLELLIETGIFGLAALVIFLIWFIPRAWRLWAGDRERSYALAASVIIAAELLHSLVDYPLRTAAMSSLFAIALVLLVRPADPRHRARDPHRRSASQANGGMIRI
jgi:putative inorganic carbon (HCO3(-)) transporter